MNLSCFVYFLQQTKIHSQNNKTTDNISVRSFFFMSLSFKNSKLGTIIAFITLSLISLAGYLLLKDLNGPTFSFDPELGSRIGPRQEIILHVSDSAGIRKLVITVQRGAQRMKLHQETYADKPTSIEFPFTLEDAALPDGAFTLEIKAYDASLAGFGKGNSTTEETVLNLDNQPPRISVKTLPPGVKRGGSALVVYSVNEPVRETGVYVNDIFFKGYEQKKNTYACLFPFAESISPSDFLPQIMAKDLAGNITESRLTVNARNTQFKNDTLKIDTAFLEGKKAELALLAPHKKTPLEQYIEANTQSRIRDNEILLNIGENSTATPLWKGAFRALPRSAAKATFGDRRTYTHDGKTIDKQVHQGLDLASVAKAPIPAANNGKVVFAEPLGIYGNLIIIDHGLGLFSIYSHLTDMNVAVGEEVKTNQTIGTTGKSGLAGGDHVHFGFLVGGVPVQPKEWLDSKWIRNNITSRLSTAR